MHNDVTPILQDPRTLFVAFCRRGLMSARLHLNTNLVRQRMHLTSARTGRDHEEIHDWCDKRQIEDDGLFTAVFLAKFGNVAGIFQAALQPGLGGGIGDGSGNGDAPSGQSTDALLAKRAFNKHHDDRQFDQPADTVNLYEVHYSQFKGLKPPYRLLSGEIHANKPPVAAPAAARIDPDCLSVTISTLSCGSHKTRLAVLRGVRNTAGLPRGR